MINAPILTIAFPTFNRSCAISDRVEELFLKPLPSDITVLVIDNNSSDGTWITLLEKRVRFPELVVVRNSHNLGFAGNFIRLFENCNAKFLMVMSDEDAVIVDELAAYVEFLKDSDAALISPQAVIYDRIYRGRTRRRAISLADFREATNYISGCTFHTQKSKAILPRIKSVISLNSAAHVYPQVILSGELLLDYPGVWYPHSLSLKRQQLEPQISDLDGSLYSDLPSRYRQTLDFVRYFDDLDGKEVDFSRRSDGIRRIKKQVRSELIHLFRNSLRAADVDLADSFDMQARRFYRRGSRIKSLFGQAVQNPRMVAPALRKRFFELSSFRGS